VARYHKALSLKPDYAEAHNNLGNVLRDLRKHDDAAASYRKAIGLKPEYEEAHNNLGTALQSLGKLDESIASYRTALDLNPKYALAHHNLASVLQDLGSLEDAVISYNKALELEPDLAETHSNLGTTLKELGKLEDAAKSYQRALEIRPDFADGLGNYGVLLLALGRQQEALSCFREKRELVRGEIPVKQNLETFRFISRAKIRHDIEQFRYLASLGTDTHRFAELADTYSDLEREIQWPEDDAIGVSLTKDQHNRIRSSYNRAIHLTEAPEIAGSALGENLDAKSITTKYIANDPGMTYFDNFLHPKALQQLQRLLMESTIWHDFQYSGGYLGAVLTDGLACPLLFQIADELRQTFPVIFKNHTLNQLWAYKYDSQLSGINVHADFAAVNVNFWVTPDSANLNPKTGGLIVHKKKAPLDWGFNRYNPGSQKGDKLIREFLEKNDEGKVTVPYAQNRVVMFNSDLFHETDTIEFKPGYQNRRINITMLFGNRRDE